MKYINEIKDYFFKKPNMETIQNLEIENALNSLLTKLDNFDLEYKQLFDIGKVELQILLSKERERINQKTLERIQNIKPYSIWSEITPKGLNSEEKKEYVNGYNQALEDFENRFNNFIDLYLIN